ncbi:MAG TPA: winged helix-turn-helix domain-containing protein [Candidatus Acidoferrales bacterium]|nr:winged helix-turn-helix domain-containing protein [Candidatus Acidoferrales bacterium]
MVRRSTKSPEPNVAEVGALIGDPGRAAMLMALIDGRELSASELALRAGVTPQAASAHLKKLTGAGMILGRTAGRHRFFRLASSEIGHALESLAAIASPVRIVALDQSTKFERMRAARSCYDHLAGRLGVAVTDALVSREAIARRGSAFVLARSAPRVFGDLAIDLDEVHSRRREFARACTDWTERRAHLAGSLGASLLELFLRNRWIARTPNDRSLRVTPEGTRELRRRLDLTW